jgi:phosphatidate cytidylyltransferase
LFALLVNVLFYVFFANHLPLSFIKSCIFTVCLAWGAVLSDLVESLLKRHLSVKDSGRVIPGIGGILDLVDSLLLNAPLAYWLLKYGV